MTFIDTAGLESEPGDEVEAEGQRRALRELEKANLILMVYDKSRPLNEGDRKIQERYKEAKKIAILNKKDLVAGNSEKELNVFSGTRLRFCISLKRNRYGGTDRFDWILKF